MLFIIKLSLGCKDEPAGYDGYACDGTSYCDKSGDYCPGDKWYDNWKKACKKTCNICRGKYPTYPIPNSPLIENIDMI